MMIRFSQGRGCGSIVVKVCCAFDGLVETVVQGLALQKQGICTHKGNPAVRAFARTQDRRLQYNLVPDSRADS